MKRVGGDVTVEFETKDEVKEIVNVLREHMSNHPTPKDEMTSAKKLFAILDNALDVM